MNTTYATYAASSGGPTGATPPSTPSTSPSTPPQRRQEVTTKIELHRKATEPERLIRRYGRLAGSAFFVTLDTREWMICGAIRMHGGVPPCTVVTSFVTL